MSQRQQGARPYVTKALALSLGLVLAWAVVVRPVSLETARARAQVEAQQAAIEAHERASSSRGVSAGGLLERAREEGEALLGACRAGRDATLLYETVNRLASEHSVTVERMEPSGVKSSSRGKVEGGVLDETGYSISVAGGYAEVARFVDAVSEETGITMVASLRIAPSSRPDQEDGVRATLETLHLAPSDGFLPARSASEGDV